MSIEQLKAYHAISKCRSSELGGHADKCSNCGIERISYNSCRNRHCPKCQFLKKEKWLLDREKDCLPVPYFHIVFTLPSELNPVIWQNKKTLLNLFFQCVSQTLQKACHTKLKGAKVGIICILHTWGQTLTDHPHIHCIVTGGGLSGEHKKWIHSNDSFFIHIKVLSRIFRGKFLSGLKKLADENKISFHGSYEYLREKIAFQNFIDSLYRKKWVVFCKKPFSNSENLFRYLSRYTHRVAISNHRILDLDEEHVSFQYRNRANANQIKTMKLSHAEFIRRFLLHILPSRFVKIRYYGLLANRNRRVLIGLCRKLLNCVANIAIPDYESLDWKELLKSITGVNVDLCNVCKTASMAYFKELIPVARSP